MSVFANLERLRAAYAGGSRRPDREKERRTSLKQRRDVGGRIRRGQLDLMDLAAKTVSGNLIAAVIVAIVIRKSVGPVPLLIWLICLGGIAGFLMRRVKWYQQQDESSRLDQDLVERRLNEHAILSVALGATWGAFIIYYGPALPTWNLVIVSMIVLGCISGSVSAIGASLPVFFGYYFTVLPSVIYAHLMQNSDDGGLLAFLLAIYGGALIINVLTLNRSVISALRQRAKAEILADNLVVAEAATEAATRSKWESFAHLSHELRTPMNAVLGFSDMMRQQMFGPLSPRYLDYSHSIHDSGGAALRLIDSILEVSRARTGSLALSEVRFDIVKLIENLVQDFAIEAASGGIDMETSLRDPGVFLFADEDKIRQVLHNLLSNALKYTAPGGHVALALTYDEIGLCVTVSDTGVGIAADEIALCQEPFVRLGDPLVAGAKGAGLGLPIARHLLEAHGGNLSIESRLGHGTAVTIVLPPSRCVAKVNEPITMREMPYLRIVGQD